MTSNPSSSARPGKGGGKQAAKARREAARKAEQRRRLMIAGGAVAAVVVVVAALVAIALTSGGKKAAVTKPAPQAAVANVTKVPQSVWSGVRPDALQTVPQPIQAPPLTKNGKPEVLYVGAEYCPFCAAERWPLVMALSRFGTFSGLKETKSGPPPEVHPNTPTFSFLGSSYTSDYLDFEAVETQDTAGKKLETLTKEQQDLLSKYNAPPYVPQSAAGAIPWLDYGGKFVSSGASYDPTVLKGLSFEQIAQQAAKPDTAVGRSVIGTANVITGALCALTGDKPANVCTTGDIPAIEKQLVSGGSSSGG